MNKSRKSDHHAAGFQAASGPVFQFVAEIERNSLADRDHLLGKARALLVGFDDQMLKTGALASTVPPARYALAVLIDDAVRQVPGVDVGAWSAASHRTLFDGRDMSWDTIGGFAQTARDQGGDFTPVAEFLETVIGRAQTKRRAGRRRAVPRSGVHPRLLPLLRHRRRVRRMALSSRE